MSEESINIRFPDQMEVRAPRTDQQIDSLRTSFNALFEILQVNLETLTAQTGSIREIPALLTHLENTITTQFEKSLLHQFEAAVMTHQAEIVSDEKRLQALLEFLERKESQFSESLKRIQERYTTLLGKVAENNAQRRRVLDSHAYALIEETYEREIRHRFSAISLPAYGYLAAHANEVAQVRTAALLEAFGEARAAIERYQEEQDATSSHMANFIHGDLAPGKYSIPVWAVELEDIQSGERRWELRVPDGMETDAPELFARIRDWNQAAVGNARGCSLDAGLVDELAALLERNGSSCRSEVDRFRQDTARAQARGLGEATP